MSGVCSRHQHTEPGCAACVATPAMVLGVTEEVWAAKLAEAEASGRYICWKCGFEQYRTWPVCCVLCGAPYREESAVNGQDRC